MRLHDWTRVDDGTFHDFHNSWVVALKNSLNRGLLPRDYYAQVEQHINRYEGDILTLTRPVPDGGNGSPLPPVPPPGAGAVAVVEAPPKAELHLSGPKYRRRTVTVRHASSHRIVALIEVVSPGNKDRSESVAEFVTKAEVALGNSINITILDLIPVGRHDPDGMAAAVWEEVGGRGYERPADKPLTFAAIVAPRIGLYADHRAAGDELPETPLFLTADHYIKLPLGTTYEETFRGIPAIWREVLEAPPG
jgi:hypothetical protein